MKNQSENKRSAICKSQPKTAETGFSNKCDDALYPFVKEMMRATVCESDREIVIVCFGTMSISGDSLGPQVGTLLTKKYNVPAFVYGTDECCVNGKNMKEWMSFIKQVHKDAVFVAVDASLGARSKVGQIVFREDGVCPAGVKGNKLRFGDIGILAVVAQNSSDPLMQLMTVSPLYVEEMANKLANMISYALL